MAAGGGAFAISGGGALAVLGAGPGMGMWGAWSGLGEWSGLRRGRGVIPVSHMKDQKLVGQVS